jgi:hypothetical protein
MKQPNNVHPLNILLLWGLVFLTSSQALAGEAPVKQGHFKKVDLDRDGYQETQLFYDGKVIEKALIDENRDKKVDGTIWYKNGFRDKGERDINFDGRIDTWIKYYITGVPWIIARDKNNDGRADYWKHIKNGFIYKREWDRNFDGRPDVRMLIPGKADLREIGETKQILTKQFDDDFDGVFEKEIKISKRMPHIQVKTTAGSISET